MVHFQPFRDKRYKFCDFLLLSCRQRLTNTDMKPTLYVRFVDDIFGTCVTGEKMEITFYPNRGSNPVRWTQSPTLYYVAIKAGLYRKAVQVSYIPIPGDILPLQIKIRPWISRSPRLTWNETQGVLCTHVGYLRWAPNVTGEIMEITFSPTGDQTRSAGLKVLHSTTSL